MALDRAQQTTRRLLFMEEDAGIEVLPCDSALSGESMYAMGADTKRVTQCLLTSEMYSRGCVGNLVLTRRSARRVIVSLSAFQSLKSARRSLARTSIIRIAQRDNERRTR